MDKPTEYIVGVHFISMPGSTSWNTSPLFLSTVYDGDDNQFSKFSMKDGTGDFSDSPLTLFVSACTPAIFMMIFIRAVCLALSLAALCGGQIATPSISTDNAGNLRCQPPNPTPRAKLGLPSVFSWEIDVLTPQGTRFPCTPNASIHNQAHLD